MRTFKFAIPVAVLMAGLFVCTSLSFGKAAYTKKEKKGCIYCHVSAGSKDLNAAGKYYKEHNNSLEGYVPPAKQQ
jgi:hypothetical protein